MPPSTVVVTTALEASAMSSTPSSSGGLSSAATSGIIAGCVALVLTTTNEDLQTAKMRRAKPARTHPAMIPPVAAELSPPDEDGVEEAVALVSTWITCAEIR